MVNEDIRANTGLDRRQAGFMSLPTLYLVGTALFLLLLAVRLVPAYVNHQIVKTSLDSLRSDSTLGQKSRGEIVNLLEKRWQVDDISDVTSDNITVTREDEVIRVRVEYDVVKPVLGNVSALVHFDDAVEVNVR